MNGFQFRIGYLCFIHVKFSVGLTEWRWSLMMHKHIHNRKQWRIFNTKPLFYLCNVTVNAGEPNVYMYTHLYTTRRVNRTMVRHYCWSILLNMLKKFLLPQGKKEEKTIKFIIHRRLHAASNVNNIFNNSKQIEESELTVCLNLFNNIIWSKSRNKIWFFFVVAIDINAEDNLRSDIIHRAHTVWWAFFEYFWSTVFQIDGFLIA